MEEDAAAPTDPMVWAYDRTEPATEGIVPVSDTGTGATAALTALDASEPGMVPLGGVGLATPVLEVVARLVIDPLATAALAFEGGVRPWSSATILAYSCPRILCSSALLVLMFLSNFNPSFCW